MVYKFFDKKSAGSSVNTPLELNEQLDEELQKPLKILKKAKFILDSEVIFGVLI